MTFTITSLQQSMKVVDVDHETGMSQDVRGSFGLSKRLDIVCNKSIYVALMEFCPRQDMGKVRNFVAKSA